MLTDQLSSADLGVLLQATGAVSGLSTSPLWRLEVNGHLIDVYLDGTHLRATAPVARARRIATGAAIFDLRCAAASLGFDSWVSICPYPEDPGLAARIVVEPTSLPDQDLLELYNQTLMLGKPRSTAPLDRAAQIALTRAAVIENIRLTWLPRPLTGLATLSTDHDEPRDQLLIGIARQRVLLTARAYGVPVSCLHQTLIRFGREPGEPARTDDR